MFWIYTPIWGSCHLHNINVLNHKSTSWQCSYDPLQFHFVVFCVWVQFFFNAFLFMDLVCLVFVHGIVPVILFWLFTAGFSDIIELCMRIFRPSILLSLLVTCDRVLGSLRIFQHKHWLSVGKCLTLSFSLTNSKHNAEVKLRCELSAPHCLGLRGLAGFSQMSEFPFRSFCKGRWGSGSQKAIGFVTSIFYNSCGDYCSIFYSCVCMFVCERGGG